MRTSIKQFIKNYVSLHIGEEKKEIVFDNIQSGISFKGSNIWILGCAIIIASVGLNVNSTAVIIGAMLISPLMGPIVGAGFSLGTYDFELLKKSIFNLFISTFVSLLVAFLYFTITPFKETETELLARTTPTIYDVIIAFFGGLAGIIALTRVEKGNPIPGVAIATALMPPLCTAGYSLSIGNFEYFLGSFYLYIINCFFICIATFLIIKYLKYNPIKIINKEKQKQIKKIIIFLILLMIIPSSYLAFNLVKQKEYEQNLNQFITNEFVDKGHILVYQKIKTKNKKKILEIACLTHTFSENELEILNNKLNVYNLPNTEIKIKQNIKNETSTQKIVTGNDAIINNLKKELSEYKFVDINLNDELKILFPEITEISYGKHTISNYSDSTQTYVLYHASREIDSLKFKNWLSVKFTNNSLKVINVSSKNTNKK